MPSIRTGSRTLRQASRPIAGFRVNLPVVATLAVTLDTHLFSPVGEHHKSVHVHAEKIVDAFHRGDRQAAADLMESSETTREKLFTALNERYRL